MERTWVQLPLELGAHGVEGAALGGEDHRIPPAAHAQGTEAPGVPDGDELLGGHDQQGEGAPQALHGPAHCLLGGGAAQPLLGNGVGDELGVGGGLEDGAPVFKEGAQFGGVHQVAVVSHRQGALDVLEGQGLGVFPLPAAGGGVAHMAHGHGAIETVQHVGVEHVSHQAHILVEGEHPLVDGGDATGLLPPVLEGVQAVIGGAGTVPVGVADAEQSAFLVNGHSHSSWEKIKWAL